MVNYPVNNHMVVFAFRYALGRESSAPGIVVDELRRLWKDLPFFDRKQIKQEIVRAIQDGSAGSQCDIDNWRKILLLERGCPIWAEVPDNDTQLHEPKRKRKQKRLDSATD